MIVMPMRIWIRRQTHWLVQAMARRANVAWQFQWPSLWAKTADRLIEALVPRIEKLKVGPYTAGDEWITAPLSQQRRNKTS